jgi:very-short-patch-repair endonuclease
MASPIARKLRSRPTEAERKLWVLLRAKQLAGYRFRRQVPLGIYVVDFLCFSKRLILEIDGGQHAPLEEADRARTAWLEAQGFRVLRFWNTDVLANPDGVCVSILRALHDQDTPYPSPPPQGGGNRREGFSVTTVPAFHAQAH